MATETVDVNPGRNADRIKIALDLVNGAFYPLYKMAFGIDGEATLVSKLKPVPVELYTTSSNPDEQLVSDLTLKSLLSEVIRQQQLTNVYLAALVGDKLGDE